VPSLEKEETKRVRTRSGKRKERGRNFNNDPREKEEKNIEISSGKEKKAA